MLAVDPLLKKGGDVDVLGLDEGIGIALAGDPKRFCHLPALHGEMLGEKWALGGSCMLLCVRHFPVRNG